MTSRRPFFRRRKLLVRRFQLRFVGASLLWFTATLLVTGALVFLPLVLELRSNTSTPESLDAATTILALHDVLWPWMGVLLALYVVHAILLSHRVAGPLARFNAVFNALEQGNVADRVRLRRHDYLHEEAAALDAALVATRERFSALREQVRSLEASVREIEGVGRQDGLTSPELTNVLGQVRALRAEIERIQLENPTRSGSGDVSSRESDTITALSVERHTSQSGFTLIEMVLVAALVSTLAAIAIPAYAEALNAARITKAIADIRAIGHALQMYALMHGSLPATLADADIQTLTDPWGNPYMYVVIPPGNPGGAGVRKDRNLHPINSDFDLYSMGRDGQSVLPLTAKASQDDIVRASDGSFIGLASNF